jgi:hypothetical protein
MKPETNYEFSRFQHGCTVGARCIALIAQGSFALASRRDPLLMGQIPALDLLEL